VGDVETMARKALEILRDDPRRVKMGQAARLKAQAQYLPEIIVPQYERLYESVL